MSHKQTLGADVLPVSDMSDLLSKLSFAFTLRRLVCFGSDIIMACLLDWLKAILITPTKYAVFLVLQQLPTHLYFLVLQFRITIERRSDGARLMMDFLSGTPTGTTLMFLCHLSVCMFFATTEKTAYP